MIKYDKAVFAATLVAHARREDSNCICGQLRIGDSHASHVARVYEAAMKAREEA